MAVGPFRSDFARDSGVIARARVMLTRQQSQVLGAQGVSWPLLVAAMPRLQRLRPTRSKCLSRVFKAIVGLTRRHF